MSQNKLVRNISMMSIAVFISRIFGLVRDIVMANFFGATFLNDAFIVAYKIPNLLRLLFGEGALSTAFVPLYNEIGIKEGKERQMNFALQVISILCFFLIILSFWYALGTLYREAALSRFAASNHAHCHRSHPHHAALSILYRAFFHTDRYP